MIIVNSIALTRPIPFFCSVIKTSITFAFYFNMCHLFCVYSFVIYVHLSFYVFINGTDITEIERKDKEYCFVSNVTTHINLVHHSSPYKWWLQSHGRCLLSSLAVHALMRRSWYSINETIDQRLDQRWKQKVKIPENHSHLFSIDHKVLQTNETI